MKKLISLLSVIIFFVLSCSSDDTVVETTPVGTNSILVKKIIKPDLNNTSDFEIYTFTYNGNKLLKVDYQDLRNNVVNYSYTDVYYYTGDLITKVEIIQYGVVSSYVSFEYNNGKLISERMYSKINIDASFYENYRYEYIHNLNGTITSKLYNNNYLSSGVDDFTLIKKYLIEKNANQEVSKVSEQIYPYWSSTDVYEYDYDSNNSFAKNILGFNKLILFKGWFPKSTGIYNNISSIKTNGIITESSVYQYNSSGFPVSSIVSDVGITEFQFFY